ncbi:MAG: sigma-70 family RNA polymerase sigma factor [Firmicutes bacterium]|nr:sigma-70 family RNA polymerase sigma factor [Bacillota bacterium]
MQNLIKKAKKGDKKSLSKAIFLIKDDAYKIAYCYLHNKEDSMDAVANAVEKAILNIKNIKKTKFFKTWFIRIVINECNMKLRKREKIMRIDDLSKEKSTKKTNKEEKMDLNNSLNKLSPSDKSLIYMKYYLGYTLKEISELMDLPLSTVKTRIYKNLKLLKKELEIKEV